MVCSFGTLLNILALLLVFSFSYYFYGLYFIQQKNKVPGNTVTAGELFKSLIDDEKSLKDVMILQKFDGYSWANTKASGIGSSHRMESPDEDNFVIKVSELQAA
jgi:hypothetical protein